MISIADASGDAVTINTYDEYGAPGAGNEGLFQYTGQPWLDDVSLYHYRARAYSPTLGRFLQTDPILFEGGMNVYAYVVNDPLNLIDPNGLCWLNVVYTTTAPTPRPDGTIIPTGGVYSAYSFPISCGGGAGDGQGGPGNGPGSLFNEVTGGNDWTRDEAVVDRQRTLRRFACDWATQSNRSGREYGLLFYRNGGQEYRTAVVPGGIGGVNMIGRADALLAMGYVVVGAAHTHPYPETRLENGRVAADFGFSWGFPSDLDTAARGLVGGAPDSYAVYSDRTFHVTRSDAAAGYGGRQIDSFRCPVR